LEKMDDDEDAGGGGGGGDHVASGGSSDREALRTQEEEEEEGEEERPGLPEEYRTAGLSLAAYLLCWALLRWYQVRSEGQLACLLDLVLFC